MNTLPHIAALVASLWLAVFCFDTLSNVYLGTGMIVVFFYVIVSAVFAVAADLAEFGEFDG
tara:strand:+ start:1535 stop:1717 length:183 start_codon:yes stop_codon:yes gene_type:complete